MQFADTLKHFRRDSGSLASKLGFGLSDNMLGANFRTYGKEFGTVEFEDFKAYARRIYKEAQSNPGGFTLMKLPRGRIVVDFQGKLRGVYTGAGEPLAFYNPDYKARGYHSAAAELADFKTAVI